MHLLAWAWTWVAPLFESGGPIVRGPPPPEPPALPGGLSVLVFGLTVLAMLWWIARRFARGTKHAARIAVFGAVLGNALMDLAAVMQPERPSVVQIERLREARVKPASAADAKPVPPRADA